MQISEIKELTTEEIRERIEAEQASYQQKRIDHYVSPAENPAAFREQRRTIARLKTVLAERETNNYPCRIDYYSHGKKTQKRAHRDRHQQQDGQDHHRSLTLQREAPYIW